MTTVALRGILGRKLRTALTAFAIVLGVAMVGGGFLLTDSISKAFDTIFASSYAQTDAVVSGRSLTDYSNAGRASVSPQLLARVRHTPGVEAAAGEIFDLNSNSDVAKSSKSTESHHRHAARRRSASIRRSCAGTRCAASGGSAAASARSSRPARRRSTSFAVGGRIRMRSAAPRVRHGRRRRALREREHDRSATFAVVDVNVAQRLLHKPGDDAISVAAKPGVSAHELVSRLRAIVPAHAQVRTGDEQAQEDKKGVAGFVGFLRYVLLGFGGLALFVGAFVIFNTLSITVAQRHVSSRRCAPSARRGGRCFAPSSRRRS